MVIPGYTLDGILGSGVYSTVYRAHKPSRGHGWALPVALKVLKQEFHYDAWVLQCFRREGIVGQSVKHPSLISIQTPMPRFHICKVVPGYTLRDAALLPRSIVLNVIEQIASALATMHYAGFLHGDVKPGNIMVAPDGHATLIDLGFARRPGSLPIGDGLPGTPNYLAPELCRRDFVDTPAADVFALGVTAFELLTGELPYPRLAENAEVLCQHRDEQPQSIREVDPELPASTANLIDGMLTPKVFARLKANRVAAILKSIAARRREAA